MKLLSKSTIASDQARQRKAQIDEGLGLASRVDALRRTLAELEKQHSTYIAGMKQELEEQTQWLVDSIRDKKKEISDLESQRAALLVPLDAKWAEVNEKSRNLDSLVATATKTNILLSRGKEKYDLLVKKSKDSFSRTRVKERELSKVYAKAEDALVEAEEMRNKSETELDNQRELTATKLVELYDQQRVNAFDSVANENQKRLLDEREIELDMRERAIDDKYATLERTLKRKNG